MKDFYLLEKNLGVNFKDKDLLSQAFVHRSYLNENPDFRFSHNERLEFLGDAVLEQVVTEHLFRNYPQKTEGELTSWRAALVNTKMLAKISRKIGFNDFLLLSQGEIKEEGRAREVILANTFEAFVGSLYLDQGLDSCNNFIEKNLLGELPDIIKNNLFKDSKSRFQEEAQERTGFTPVYNVIGETGPDHDKKFKVSVLLGKETIAAGEGPSKQEAEEAAAEEGLRVKKW